MTGSTVESSPGNPMQGGAIALRHRGAIAEPPGRHDDNSPDRTMHR
ncbi:hypothetical protein [Leptolyngbya iicbica]|uniref:Uncharacterized protein n=1 Tax=Lyngbya confervoides BDU141951 TaxID=1574623 RepID=A0A8T6QTY9_9CYAN|nr:hypothetical protein [Leptolyngbya sp. LK]